MAIKIAGTEVINDNRELVLAKLAEINSSIAVTAVDVFVYDTSKDSDGGAWRKRTQHTSWYNETLNTDARGSRREFPAVAVIVAESNKVTIYDGDDPSLPMWMVFNQVTGVTPQLWRSGRNATSVTMRNANLVIGLGASDNASGVIVSNFVSDASTRQEVTTTVGPEIIADRNSGQQLPSTSVGGIVSAAVNDVAMTVLPNAPVDPATGLPVPTIAVATNGGVSVIKDDGTVVDIASSPLNKAVSFTEDRLLAAYTYFGFRIDDISDADTTDATWGENGRYGRNTSSDDLILVSANTFAAMAVEDNLYHSGSAGLSSIYENQPAADKGMIAYTTAAYNTGWMNGDIKGAFLADTDDTDLVGYTAINDDGTSTTGWSDARSNGTVTSTGGRIRSTATASGSYGPVKTLTGLVIGKKYVYSADVFTAGGSGSFYFRITPVSDLNDTSRVNVVSSSDFSPTATFVADNTTMYVGVIHVAAAGGDYVEIDNVSVKLADADRSVNNNGLIVNGTVTRSPVATGAELVAYSGFSASNYLEQPYNSDLDFGTGDFSVMGWVKQPDMASASGGILLRETTFNAGSGFGLYFTNGQLAVMLGGTAALTDGVSYDDGAWKHLVLLRLSGQAYLYVNGSQVWTAARAGSVTDATATTRLGIRHDGQPLTTGSLALWRISATAPTADQIKKIYEDEKVLFQENAACTLYGASDAVTALAHDPVTDLLHVGTSAGRSVFSGLRRVSNTTTAVGTAISASNGLVVEE